MRQNTLRKVVHDILICVMVGALIALALALILFIAGLLVSKFDVRNALVIVRGGLLIAGSLELLVSAGCILSKKDVNKVRNYGKWKRNFQIFGLVPVLLVTSAVVLTLGSFVDYYLYF